MRGPFRRLRSLGQVHFLLIVLAAGPAFAQDMQAPQQADSFPEPGEPAPPPAAPPLPASGPRRLPVPVFRPVALPAYGDFPPPPGYIEKVQHNRGLVGVGAGVFLASYAIGIAYAASTSFKEQSGWVVAPVVGPFVAAGQRDFACTATTPQGVEVCQKQTVSEAGAVAILAGIGVGHLLGASLMAAGFLDRRRVWLRDDLVSFNVQMGPGSGMLRVGGRF